MSHKSMILLRKADHNRTWLPRLPFSDDPKDWGCACHNPPLASAWLAIAGNEETLPPARLGQGLGQGVKRECELWRGLAGQCGRREPGADPP